LGNKRKLLPYIEEEIIKIKQALGKEKLSTLDIFSGSGCVARLLKAHSSALTVNDLEKYSYIINSCYLTNRSTFDDQLYEKCAEQICSALEKPISGIITKNYAPSDENNIKKGERVFYTPENARIIDTVRAEIDKLPKNMQPFFLAPLLAESSVHANTSGVFKGFYKSKKTGIGIYGGDGENALSRIKGKIRVKKPVLSNFECDCNIFCEDANVLAKNLAHTDLAYIDPPYDQHPYGSNYFMLNVITDNCIKGKQSAVSGIPSDWNRSEYNKPHLAAAAFENLISDLDAEYMIISYNSEGFISHGQMLDILNKYGDTMMRSIQYNTFRGSRNLRQRDIHVDEYLFILHKK
jgi:adenine-specific DNA-methyltransferase